MYIIQICDMAGIFAQMKLPWSELPSFLAVARNGSLNAAAKVMKVDRTTVARHLENMEVAAKEPLFERIDGRFTLTGFGRRAFAAAEIAEQGLTVFEKGQDDKSHKNGRVRVSLSEHLLLTLSSCFKAFSTEHPDILLELTATDRTVDLQHFEADVVLRMCRGAPSGLRCKNIGQPVFSLYQPKANDHAKLSYIARPSETDVPKYLTSYIPNAQIFMAVDGLVSMREMIAEGAGVGILPNYFGDDDSRLQLCSPALPSIGYSLFIAFLPEQRNVHRIKIFAEFTEKYLRKVEGFVE